MGRGRGWGEGRKTAPGGDWSEAQSFTTRQRNKRAARPQADRRRGKREGGALGKPALRLGPRQDAYREGSVDPGAPAESSPVGHEWLGHYTPSAVCHWCGNC